MDAELDGTVNALARRLVAYCVLRTRQMSIAEDIAQESLTALVQRWRRYGKPASPEGFVFAIARRRCARAVVRQRLWLPVEHLISHHSNGRDPETQLMQKQDWRRLEAALRRLNRLDRELLLLLGVGELAEVDAARMLGIADTTLRTRAFRARKRLRALLENDDGSGTR